MKNLNQMMFNPFVRIAGYKSLLLGLAIMLVTSVIAYFSHARFDGVLDMHGGKEAAYISYLTDGLIAWLSVVVIFYPTIMIITKFKVRFIDVAGTFLLARIPMLIDAILLFFLENSKVNTFLDSLILKTKVENTIQIMDWVFFISAIILTILCTIWFIALNYNAFRLNANIKGAKGAWIFAIGMLLAEILSKVIFIHFNDNFYNINL